MIKSCNIWKPLFNAAFYLFTILPLFFYTLFINIMTLSTNTLCTSLCTAARAAIYMRLKHTAIHTHTNLLLLDCKPQPHNATVQAAAAHTFSIHTHTHTHTERALVCSPTYDLPSFLSLLLFARRFHVSCISNVQRAACPCVCVCACVCVRLILAKICLACVQMCYKRHFSYTHVHQQYHTIHRYTYTQAHT